ncbi:MAG: hypothetical protein CMI00_08425 [Oceanospirillaceae bacterium]|nr:hypothetical protein [Oceanospirillaceae bacterium]|tara:strand:+ start:124 stop:813 length:690 start_codon:yes stop_codon:yes gene_type:complete
MKIIKCLSVLLLLPVTLWAENRVFTGEARSLSDGRLLYRETHTLQLDSDRPISGVVEYHDAEGVLIARKTNQYHERLATTDFVLMDMRNDYREQAQQTESGWRLSQTENGKSTSADPGQPEHQPVVDAGFDEFVREHWQALLDDQTIFFSFAVPARLEWISFRLIPVRVTDTELTVEMKLRSRMLAWLLDPIILTYDLKTRQLLRYRGLTNIQDENGKGIHAEITYHYD